jgi:hypothetical protein
MDNPNKKDDAQTPKTEEEKTRRRTSMEAAKVIEDEYERIMNGGSE